MLQIPELAAANPIIMGLLEFVLDRRDRQVLTGAVKEIVLTLDPRRAPRALRAALQPFSDPAFDDGELWDELVWFCREYGCFSVQLPQRRLQGRPDWEGSRLHFADKREAMVREWLARPRPVRVDPEWQVALDQFSDRIENPAAFPPGGLPLDAGFRSYRQLLACWAAVGDTLMQSDRPTWRQLSAHCFLGDSKYLDAENRQALVRMLFPGCCDNIRERPLLMHLYLPTQVQRVLLVENQDSFLALADCRPESTGLVYIEGYRGGAARVRAPGVARFSTLNQAPEALRRDFLQWWQNQGSWNPPVYFWGDLDYEGLHIAASLKRSFVELDCWQAGYDLLLHRLEEGGHPPDLAGKSGQRPLAQSGCPYADRHLVPALRRSGCYVDQEALTASQLRSLVSGLQL